MLVLYFSNAKCCFLFCFFFFSSRRRHTRSLRDWSSDVCSSDLYRIIVPFLRGYGPTRFLSPDTFRNGQPAALAVDVTALMAALKIDTAILAGFDWGGRSADIIAALWPERCKALVSVSGYLIGSQELGKTPLPP